LGGHILENAARFRFLLLKVKKQNDFRTHDKSQQQFAAIFSVFFGTKLWSLTSVADPVRI
jgi:hypothetical protein